MQKLLRNIGLTALLSTALLTGCSKAESTAEEVRGPVDAFIEFNSELDKAAAKYGDKNNDGVISPEERNSFYQSFLNDEGIVKVERDESFLFFHSTSYNLYNQKRELMNFDSLAKLLKDYAPRQTSLNSN